MQQNLMGEKAFRTETIKSISYNQNHILKYILKLHCNNANTFDCDPCFGLGNFYIVTNLIEDYTIPAPDMIFDIEPRVDCVEKCDCTNLSNWFKDNECKSIIFDPPFCFGIHGKAEQNISAQRFTMFKDFDSLKQMYYNSLKEFYRILEPNGILVVKCQDYTDSKTTFTHCLVYNWAIELGFYAIDLFILLNNSRIDNRLLEQRVSRKCHSYFWVFKKCNIKNLR